MLRFAPLVLWCATPAATLAPPSLPPSWRAAVTSSGPLPIDNVLDDIVGSLAVAPNLVLQAPPGAGKTTRVPLAVLLASPTWLRSAKDPSDGKIIVLEPRRIAARGAAARMASTLGSAVGETVGYKVRHDSKTSARTQVEVVTEGVLLRRLSADPELTGVNCVMFDEVSTEAGAAVAAPYPPPTAVPRARAGSRPRAMPLPRRAELTPA